MPAGYDLQQPQPDYSEGSEGERTNAISHGPNGHNSDNRPQQPTILAMKSAATVMLHHQVPMVNRNVCMCVCMCGRKLLLIGMNLSCAHTHTHTHYAIEN